MLKLTEELEETYLLVLSGNAVTFFWLDKERKCNA